jgi:hypothetical protein
MDFELALQKAAQVVFPNAKIMGCFFHLMKAVRKWLKNHNFETKEILDKLREFCSYDRDPISDLKSFISLSYTIHNNC